MKYHKFTFKKSINFILVEPKPQKFIWLSIYLAKYLRNQQISKEISVFILGELKGEHEIHWNKNLKCFNHLSKKYNWKIKKESHIFADCQFTSVRDFNDNSAFTPFFKKIIAHNVTNNCPKLTNYYSLQSQRQILRIIKNYNP